MIEEVDSYQNGECPSLDVLQQFALGKGEDDSGEIEKHLSKCPLCATKLDAMETEGDSLVDCLRQHVGDTVGISLDSQVAMLDPTIVHSPELFTGRYRIGELIAQGGMGQVHRALDTVFGRQVAVKRLLPKYQRDPYAKERFLKEASMTARLQHPGIPPIHDLGILPNGDPFLVMKLITGRTLADLLKERKGPSDDLQRFLSIFEQVALAVGYAHAQGVIHRDLKPANVMVGAFGEVQVMDWGLAKHAGADETPRVSAGEVNNDPFERTMDGTIMGTVAYMAPEQARGDISQLDARTDVFSLGAILVEILTGAGLYKGEKKEDVLASAQRGHFGPALERLRDSGIHSDLAELAKGCLAVVPVSRPNDGNAVAKAIVEHAAKVEDLLRKAEAERATATEQAKQRRLIVIGVCAIASVLAVGVVVSALFGLQARQFAAQAGTETQKAIEAGKEKEREAKRAGDAEEKHKKAEAKAIEERDKAREQKHEVERQASLARITRLAESFQSAMRPWDTLNAIPFAHRGWEHSWLARQSTGTPLTLYGHESDVGAVAFSRDGSRIVSGSHDKTIKLWDARTGNELATWVGHEDRVTSIGFSPDGARIVSGSQDGTIRLWDALSGMELATMRGHEAGLTCVAFSPNGRQIASASEDKTIRLWDVQTNAEILAIREPILPIVTIAFSPDGTRIAGVGIPGLILWDAQTGEKRTTLQKATPGFDAVAFSPDGTLIASGSHENAIKLWDAHTGTELAKLGTGELYGDHAVSLAFSPDGTQVVAGMLGSVKLWDVRTKKELLVLRGHQDFLTSVAVSPDGTRVVSGSRDKTIKIWNTLAGAQMATLRGSSVAVSPDGTRLASASGNKTVTIWDARLGAELISLTGHEDRINAVTFSPDGKKIVSGSEDKTIKLWDAHSGKEVKTLRGHDCGVTTVAFSPDGTRIASSVGAFGLEGGSHRGIIKLWDAATGNDVATLRGHDVFVNSVAFSPDGTRIVSGAEDNNVKLWNAASGGEIATLTGHNFLSTVAVFSPDGKRIATGSGDMTVKLWDVQGLNLVTTLHGHQEGIHSIAFSPDGMRIASGASDSTLRLWDSKSGAMALTLTGHPGLVRSIAFGPNGAWIVSAASDNRVKFWDARLSLETLTLTGHTRGVTSAVISPDGTMIASASHDKTIKVWDAIDGAELATLSGHELSVNSVAFSPDSTRIASGSDDRTIKLWDASKGTELATLRGHEFCVNSVSFSPDGTRLASGSGDKIIKVWDVKSATELTTIPGHESGVVSVAYSRDGKHLYSKDMKERTLKWDAATNRRIEDKAGSFADTLENPNRRTQVVKNGRDVLVVRRTKDRDDLWSEDHDRREYWKSIWHAEDAAKFEAEQSWFAARWHLKRLAELKPKLCPELRRLTNDSYPTVEDFHASVAERLKRAEAEWSKRLDVRSVVPPKSSDESPDKAP